ncbi:hypothetical protein R3P38DRAFT_2419475, partial [Favolaschia claudopus]
RTSITEMQRRKFHVVSDTRHFVPAPPKKPRKNASQNTRPPDPSRTAIVDVFVKGAEEWNGRFKDYIKVTTFDPALGGYPPVTESTAGARDTTLDTHIAFDSLTQNPLTIESYIDLHGGDGTANITGAICGGGDF